MATVATGSPAYADGFGTAQLVVGDPAALTAGDTAAMTLLQNLGYTVTAVDDDAVVTAAVNVTDVVLIAPSTLGTALGNKYESVSVPQIVFASTAWDDMGLTDQDGIFADSTTLVWADTTVPVMAWLPATAVQVVPTSRPMRSMVVGNLATGATPVAVRQENTSQNVIFTFETGAALTGGATAPARRAVIGFSDGALTNLTTDGTQLVTNMVAWASQGDDVLTTAAGQPLTPALLASTAATTCSGTIVCWNLNDTGTTMLDSDNPTGPNSITPATCTTSRVCAPPCTIAGSNTTNTCVKRSKNYYTFPGWTGHTAAAPANKLKTEVNPLEAGYGQIIDDKNGQPDVSSNAAQTLNPGLGGWRIHTRLRPTLLDFGTGGSTDFQLPAASTCTNSCDQLHPSYNVVEKGRNGVTGGFYKIEIMGYTTGNFQKGSVHCVFMDDDANSTNGTLAEAYTGKPSTTNSVLLNVDAYYDIDCHRATDRNGKANISLSVSGKTHVGTQLFSRSETVEGTLTNTGANTSGLDEVAPTNDHSLSVYGSKFSIGKKPDSQNTADSFAGIIDFVTLSTS
ncbi:hypothetical protein V3N99_22125 (plasmid) [Dermatophilaceae bacterium Soc4.6]